MTRTEIERLAVLEEKVDTLTESVRSIEGKLDQAITCKADKSEVDELRKWGVTVLLGTAGFCIATIVGVVMYVVQSHIN